MKFEDCKVDMRVRGVESNVRGKHGTIVGVDARNRIIKVVWDGDSPNDPPRRYNMSIRYMEPMDPLERLGAEMRAKKAKSPDDVDRARQYAFFATCTLPGHCPKCTAPLPCKYH